MWWLFSAWALAAPQTGFSEVACPTTHARFKVRQGLGEGTTEVAALKAAHMDALRQARLDVCGAALAGSPRCDARMAMVPDFGPGEAKKVRRRYQACRSVAVDWDKVNPLEQELADWNLQLEAFGEQLHESVGEGAVYVDGPKWATGCPLGASGSHLGQKLRAALSQVATQYDPELTPLLRLRVSVNTTEATLSGELRAPGSDTWSSVTPVTWSADLMDDRPEWGEQCFDDAALGVPDGRRSGSDGLELALTLDPPRTQFCAGEQAKISLMVGRAARVRLFSVAADGSAIQVWPAQGELDRVAPGTPLSFDTAFLLGPGGQERLVAVGIAEGADWGGLGSSASCLLPSPLTQARIPAGAAVATRGYRVSSDPRVCQASLVDEQQRAQLAQILEQLPVCRSMAKP